MLHSLDRRLLRAARDQATHLTGDPNHTVAAAAMDTLGRIHTGVNVHHFTGGPCAELVALGVATSAGAGPIVKMVAVGADGSVMPPCGRDRQVLMDQHPDCEVIVPTPDGETAIPVRRLLPFAYIHPDSSPERVVWFDGRYHAAIAAGHKTATTRFDDPIAVGAAWFVFEDADTLKRLRAEITSLEPRTMATLTDDDARLEGCAAASELRDGLRGHYPDLAEDSPLTLVRFRIAQ
ncbi:MAG: ASCH domain-containing protein [Bifidobacteriaceae bacterium]|jgi:cytidine deaminase|nr:ASCH domain-containing protein [Bifidobacteriaceae bacterium]